MIRHRTSFILASSLVLLACSKDPPTPPNGEPVTAAAPTAAQESSNPQPAATPSATQAPSAASAAPSASVAAPSGPAQCPSTTRWTKLAGYGEKCGYLWTTTAADLPKPPEWVNCNVEEGDPLVNCKKLYRAGGTESVAAGLDSNGKMQIAFVERCMAPQFTIADADGPTRFALRSTLGGASPSACALKALDVTLGRWLAVAGGSEESNDPEVGHSIGNAYVGGSVGSAASVLLFQSKETFYVPDSRGMVNLDGWWADRKSKRWGGKAFDKPSQFDLSRVTDKLLYGERRGFLTNTEPDPQSILALAEGHTIPWLRHHDKQIVWQDEAKVDSKKTCSLMAGDLDKDGGLVKARRIATVPCKTSTVELGCNSVAIGDDYTIYLVSLADGSTRTLDMRAEVVAVDCKELYARKENKLFRVELSTFGEAKAPAEPPAELTISLPATSDADAGAGDAGGAPSDGGVASDGGGR